MVDGFVGIPSFEANAVAQESIAETVDSFALVAAVAVTAKTILQIGGQVIKYVYDMVKKVWIKDPKFDQLVEMYHMCSSVSIQDILLSAAIKVIKEADEQT